MARIERVELSMVDLTPKVKRTDAIQATRERGIAGRAGWGRLANVKRFPFTPHVAFSVGARVVGVFSYPWSGPDESDGRP